MGNSVKYPMRKRRGFDAVLLTYGHDKSLRGALPAPVFLLQPHQRLVGSRLMYRLAHRTLGTLALLLVGTIYHETRKHYSVVRVQKELKEIYHE